MPKRNKVKQDLFDTGAVRDRDSRIGRYDLISPIGLRCLAQRCESGCDKYPERNWEKGLPLSNILNHIAVHLNHLMAGIHSGSHTKSAECPVCGRDVVDCSNDDHAGGVMWGGMAFAHITEYIKAGVLPKELNDIPSMMVK